MYIDYTVTLRTGVKVQFWTLGDIVSRPVTDDGVKKREVQGLLEGYTTLEFMEKGARKKEKGRRVPVESSPAITVKFGINVDYLFDDSFSLTGPVFDREILSKIIESIPEPGNPGVETNLHSCNVFKSEKIGFQGGVIRE